jgi:hypothetical protein
MLDKMHARFEEVVKTGRGTKLVTSPENVTLDGPDGTKTTVTETAPLNGKVYLGLEAMGFGLVDEIGYLDDAAKAAATLANLGNAKVVQYARKKSLLEDLGLGGKPSMIDTTKAEELLSPRIMMIWRGE